MRGSLEQTWLASNDGSKRMVPLGVGDEGDEGDGMGWANVQQRSYLRQWSQAFRAHDPFAVLREARVYCLVTVPAGGHECNGQQ